MERNEFNLILEKKEVHTELEIASTVKLICQDYFNFNQIKYINVSVYDLLQRHIAPIASTVKHQSNKLDLPRHLGFPNGDDLCEASIPSRGVSAFSYFNSKLDVEGTLTVNQTNAQAGRDIYLNKEGVQIVPPFEMIAQDGKRRLS